MECRHCGQGIDLVFADLGTAPPSNAYLTSAQLNDPEQYFPLRILTCENCWLVQVEEFNAGVQLFDADYAYFSSYSTSWLDHCKRYSHEMIATLGLNDRSMVVEVAANDGYLLQYFKARNVACYGIEPTAGTAKAAREKGIDITEAFFDEALGKDLARKGQSADLMIANNVLAHVPAINDFVKGFAALLKPSGVATFEFPHLLELVKHQQFDTIYHEHYSYLSLSTVKRIFEANGLMVYDVQKLDTHGGSLRVFAQRSDAGTRQPGVRVQEFSEIELAAGLQKKDIYRGFQQTIEAVKNVFVSYLLEAKQSGLKVAAYGAAAKGCTLINYAGIRTDLLPYVVDRNPHKVGKYLPGSRIPIVDEAYFKADQPDVVVVLPWNLAPEIAAQLGYVKSWGGSIVRVMPKVEEL